MAEKFIRLPDIEEQTGLSKSTIWLWIQKGKFPQRIKLSHRISVWKQSDIDNWMIEQIEKEVK